MDKRTILIINDDAVAPSQLSDLLSRLGYSNHLELSQQRGMAWLAEGNLPLITLLNLTQAGSAGLKALKYIREINPGVPVVVVGGATQIRIIVEAVQLGACDYLILPVDLQEARATISRAFENEKRHEVKAAVQDPLFEGIFGSPDMLRAREIARTVAPTDVPVLITGESGVGKEVFARFIQSHSQRANKPLLKVNCAALPADLLESELFGYERGAFTGAVTEKAGKFELANGGTILLDEVGEMSLALQAKLLHVLQDGEYCRLGGKRQLRTDARIIASTNRKLEEAVSLGEFRDDLYFRLNVIRIKIPPLRERKEEIAFLSKYFVQKFGEKYGSSVRELPQAVLQRFMDYDWPGNVRQLENIIKRHLILPEMEIEMGDFPEKPKPKVFSVPAPSPAIPSRQPSSWPPALHSLPAEFSSLKEVGLLAAERAERELVLWMLTQTDWNRKLAARRLNVCYKALLNKIKKWQICRPPSAVARGSRRRLQASPESEQVAVRATYAAQDGFTVNTNRS